MKHSIIAELGIGRETHQLGPAKCLCYRGWDAMWTVDGTTVVCSHCDEKRVLAGTPIAIEIRPCYCCAGDDATWFTTSEGISTCSNCGARKMTGRVRL